MADLALISHGEPNWDIKVNNAIKLLNKTVSGSWSEPTETGLVFQNGFQSIGSTYSYIQLGNHKIVDLQIGVTMPNDSSSTNLIAVTLPDSIKPDHVYTEYLENDKYQVTLSGNAFSIACVNGSKWWFGSGSHYLFHAVYKA